MIRFSCEAFNARGLRAVLVGLLLATAADAATVPSENVVELDEVVVTGAQPGPSLWRVSGAPGEGEVWILATVIPMPREMHWNADQVEQILATADEVIAPARIEMDIGAGDMFKMASLARAANAVIKLPERERLRDRLPAEQYARWSRLKARHLPDDDKVERQRPMFASQALFYEAIGDAGLTRSDVAWARVSRLAADRELRVVTPTIRPPLAIDRKAYRSGIRAVAESRIDDVGCFVTTMDTLDADLAHFTRAANAWARGDLERLLPMEQVAPVPACKPVYDRAMSFQQRPELQVLALDAWRAAVEAAVADGRTALAVLPLADLVGTQGALTRLRASGHEIEVPE